MTDSVTLKRFETEGRLLKPTHNGPTPHGGRYGFRGDIVVTVEPPVTLTAAFAADDGDAGVSFLAGSLPSYKDLPALVGALGAGAKRTESISSMSATSTAPRVTVSNSMDWSFTSCRSTTPRSTMS
jgi:hypothetical protein